MPLVVARPVIPAGTTTDQVMLVPTVVDVILTKLIELPEQINSFTLENVMFGVGFIVMVNVFGEPEQPFAIGVIVIVATNGDVPVLTATKLGTNPVPLALKPILGVLFVQL